MAALREKCNGFSSKVLGFGGKEDLYFEPYVMTT
jgi:hypothetical protein